MKDRHNIKNIILTIVSILVIIVMFAVLLFFIKTWSKDDEKQDEQQTENYAEETDKADIETADDETLDAENTETTDTENENGESAAEVEPEILEDPDLNDYIAETIIWDPSWEYADYSLLHSDSVTLYRSVYEDRKVIAINAGHGTSGGNSVKTQCHPDGSTKVTGGSTGKGATHAAAVSSGTTMLDGTPEAVVTLKLAMIVKERLLDAGFSVLMIRESDDVQIDNIARTVFANQNADCHIALHYDSSENDKGFFYIGVPDIASYRSMEPVASHWQEHNAFGESLLFGMRANDVKIYSDGNLPLDLTQTSYSTVPSVDVEVGDRGSDYSEETLNKLADGIVEGVIQYFGDPKAQ